MKLNFKETIKQKTDKELEIISKDYAFYSEDERFLASNELELRKNPTKRLLSVTKIKTGKVNTFTVILLFLMLMVGGAWMVLDPRPGTIYSNIHFIQTAGIIGILFVVISLIIIVKKFLSGGFNLTITKEGIMDHSDYIKVGMIKWADIESIESTSFGILELLLIYVKTPEKYANSKIQKMQLKYNLRMYGAPVVITSRFLACSFSELEKIIMQSYENYKEKNKQ